MYRRLEAAAQQEVRLAGIGAAVVGSFGTHQDVVLAVGVHVRRLRRPCRRSRLRVIVDRELLDALGFDASTSLELRVRDGVLVVARAEQEASPRRVRTRGRRRSRDAS